MMAEAATTYGLLCVSSLVIGYYLGVGRNLLGYNAHARTRLAAAEGEDSESEDGDTDTDLTDEALARMNALRAGLLEECKLVLVVRTDLKMDKGKIAAQCSHATLACYKALAQANPKVLHQWERSGQAKVALKCSTEDEMLALERRAKELNLCARSIRDAGRTQIAAGSRTVLGIGPGPVKIIDQVTKHLKLL
ncbi:hypothetical protein L7F22_033230 [Adiantum nelumboides]|nr:hypothetical protein [Adiantum nelumboides]